MRRRTAAAGSAVFFLLAPGVVVGLIPWLLTRWQARSIVRTILRHRRAGNRDAAKAVRCLLPERLEWRRWTGTQNVR